VEENMPLEVWLESGQDVFIGGRKFVLVPVPFSRLRNVAQGIEEHVRKEYQSLLKTPSENVDLPGFIQGVVKTIDFVDVVYHLLADPKNPEDGSPVNVDVKKEFIDDYLDTPTLRRFIQKFIQVNDLEETLKNLCGLPGVKQAVEGLMATFGLALLNSLRTSTGSPLDRSQPSPFRKSTGTSQPTTTETPESGPDKPPMVM
jgi:hypothetical protein